MKFIAILALSFAFMTFSQTAVSAEKKKKKKKTKDKEEVEYIEPWGMAGCGLASTIITDKSRGSQIMVWFLGATFNTTSGANSQSSGISSGSSNCVEKKPVFARQEQEVFVESNLASLSKEASQGTGEHLVAFAEVLGCPHDKFSKMSQDKYSEIFSSYQSKDVLEGFLREVSADEDLAHACVRAT